MCWCQASEYLITQYTEAWVSHLADKGWVWKKKHVDIPIFIVFYFLKMIDIENNTWKGLAYLTVKWVIGSGKHDAGTCKIISYPLDIDRVRK